MRYRRLVIYATALIAAAALILILVRAQQQTNAAQHALAEKNYAVASNEFAAAARLLPWRHDLWEQAALAALNDQRPSDALALLQHASSLSELGWSTLAYAYLQRDDITESINAARSGLQHVQSARLFGILAAGLRAKQDWPGERDALQSQLQLDDADAGVHFRLGLLLCVLDPRNASAELEVAASRDPQYGPATQTLLAALSDSSSAGDASTQMVRIGRALGLVGEWELASSAFTRAEEINAANAEAWAWLGEAEQHTGPQGRAALDRALSLDAHSAVVRGLRGLYWSRQAKYGQMLAEYSLAAQYEPQNPAWQASIGEAHAKLGDLSAALDAYQRAVALAPNDATYWKLLAVFCSDNAVQIEDVGLPAAQKAVDLAPNDPAALDALGFADFSVARYEVAEQTFLRAIKIDRAYYAAHIHLALNYLARGNRAAAQGELIWVRASDSGGVYASSASQLLAQYFP